MNKERYPKYLDAIDIVCSECKMGDGKSCETCPAKITYDLIREEFASLGEIINGLEDTEDDEDFCVKEYETVRNYCEKRNFKLNDEDMKTIVIIGLKSAYDDWYEDYISEKKLDLDELDWRWMSEESLKKWYSRELCNRDDDCIAQLRVGDLSFDLVERCVDGRYRLWLDLYVGGIDSGYGYGKDDYPYDYFDDVTACFYSYHLQSGSYTDMKKKIKAKAIELIVKHDENWKISLTEKAKQEFHVW